MVNIRIKSDEIKKYLLMFIVFNAVFPNVLEEYNIIIAIEDIKDTSLIKVMPYSYFIDYYDNYGLNRIAK